MNHITHGSEAWIHSRWCILNSNILHPGYLLNQLLYTRLLICAEDLSKIASASLVFLIVAFLPIPVVSTSLMDLIPVLGYLLVSFALGISVWPHSRPMWWEEQAYRSVLPRGHGTIVPCQGSVLVASLLWVVESQVLPASYYSEVWICLLSTYPRYYISSA